MAKMIIDAPNTCKECMDMGLACGMVHKDFDIARKANCPLNILPEGSIFTKDEVLSIIKEKYIHKADYENRKKADMITKLEEIKREMNPIKECEYQIYGKEHWRFAGKCQDIIQEKIDELKVESEET